MEENNPFCFLKIRETKPNSSDKLLTFLKPFTTEVEFSFASKSKSAIINISHPKKLPFKDWLGRSILSIPVRHPDAFKVNRF